MHLLCGNIRIQMKTVHILRGVSGAGKSTYTKKTFPGAFVASADHFFGTGDDYKFDPKKLGAAHADCQARFQKAVSEGVETIVVDNTNTQLWEFSSYVQFAKRNGYDVEVVRLLVDPEVAAKRNVHGVPKETVLKMQNRFQDFPGETIIQ